jgi:hypothetical protein
VTTIPALTNADMKFLQTHVAFLTLENPGNFCFANAAVLSCGRHCPSRHVISKIGARNARC